MKRVGLGLLIALGTWILSSLLLPTAPDARAGDKRPARGVVFHDRNGNGKQDAGEEGLPDVRVSDGERIVRTDEEGRWELPASQDAIYFVIKPRGWMPPVDEKLNLPRFYYVHKPNGSPKLRFRGHPPTGPLPESIPFPLRPHPEPDRFDAIFFGDPQPRNKREVEYIGRDVVPELIGTDAAFGVSLGDIVFDNLSLLDDVARQVARIGIPWFNLPGNHDVNRDAPDDKRSDETFERLFGPGTYSFDWGPAHFIVLDNVLWHPATKERRARYSGGFTEAQLDFIARDLALVPREKLVVLFMHIPLIWCRNRTRLYRLIEKRPACLSVAAHTHYQQHRYLTRADGWRGKKPHHHLINVTVSGSWWRGLPDESGIPNTTMRCGAPNGYTIFTADGNDYRLRFKGARKPASEQMRITMPDVIARDEVENTTVWVNVYGGSTRSTAIMRVDDGPWRTLHQTSARDPYYLRLRRTEKDKLPRSRRLPGARFSSHLWQGTLPSGLGPGRHTLTVRSRDAYGAVHHETATFRVDDVD